MRSPLFWPELWQTTNPGNVQSKQNILNLKSSTMINTFQVKVIKFPGFPKWETCQHDPPLIFLICNIINIVQPPSLLLWATQSRMRQSTLDQELKTEKGLSVGKNLEKKLRPATEERRHCDHKHFHFHFFFKFYFQFFTFIMEGFVGREVASGQREERSHCDDERLSQETLIFPKSAKQLFFFPFLFCLWKIFKEKHSFLSAEKVLGKEIATGHRGESLRR